MKIYFDFNDWWIGYYRGSNYHYICFLPCLVIKWGKMPKIIYCVNCNEPINLDDSGEWTHTHTLKYGCDTKRTHNKKLIASISRESTDDM